MTKPTIQTLLASLIVTLVAASGDTLFAQADNDGPDNTPRTRESTNRMHFVLVSKSHFDIGYSALARDVEHEYGTTMIDRALETGSADLETLARCFIYSSRIARQYGLPLPNDAKMTDVPGHDWIIPTLLQTCTVTSAKPKESSLAGASGPLTVTLPAGLKAATAQPANLRGEKTGQPIPITDGKLTFALPAYAPTSFILDSVDR